MDPRPIVHIELLSADARATEAFYIELFGWKFEYANWTRTHPNAFPPTGAVHCPETSIGAVRE